MRQADAEADKLGCVWGAAWGGVGGNSAGIPHHQKFGRCNAYMPVGGGERSASRPREIPIEVEHGVRLS